MEQLKNLSLPNERWRYIEGFYDKYAVSDLGRIASFKKSEPIIMKPNKSKKGYLKCVFQNEGKEKTVMPHRLVALSFVPNIEGKLEVNHINGIKADNQATNLEWVTRGENCRHAVENGLHRGFDKGHQVINRPKGSKVHTSVLNEDQVRGIRADRSEGLKHRELAEKYKIKMSSVRSALFCWKHL